MSTSQVSAVRENGTKAIGSAERAFHMPLARGNPPELQSFVQFVSHDLQVPLRFMNHIAQRLLDAHDTDLPDDVASGIAAIVSGTGEMSKLLKNLLVLSRLGSGNLDRRPIDMQELVHQVLDELQVEIGDRDVAICIGILPPCRGDRVLLKQVYSNLLTNALKFTRDRPRAVIRIGSVMSRGGVVYAVQDNGIGFEPENSRLIFLPFERLKSAKDFEGSGVGMALVKQIVEYHRGRVWADGRPNQGAAFYFSIGK